MTHVKLPKVLDPSSMRVARDLHPLSMPLTLDLMPPSTAQMVLGEGESVNVRDWVRIYTASGDAGIYRVTAVTPRYSGVCDVTLAHGIVSLRDDIIPGRGDLSGQLADVVAELLKKQTPRLNGRPLWQIGERGWSESIKVQYAGGDLLTVLQNALEKVPLTKLVLDQSTTPWTINIVRENTVPRAEGRFGRNMIGVQVTTDDDDLCTRVYVDGKDGYTDADTIGDYGIIAKTISVPAGSSDADVSMYVREYLNQHKQPNTTIEIDALDLFSLTGESWDKLDLGAFYRCVMPDYGVTLRNRLVRVEYTDLMADPYAARVSIANRQKNIEDLLMDQQNAINSNSSGYSYASSMINSMGVDLYEAIDYQIEFQGQVGTQFNEVWIDLEAATASVELVAHSVTTLEGQVSENTAQLVVQSNLISTKVSNGEVISAINQTAETIQIMAQRIDLSGYVTASQLEASLANIFAATINSIQANMISASSVSATFLSASSFTFASKQVSRRTATIGDTTINYLAWQE